MRFVMLGSVMSLLLVLFFAGAMTLGGRQTRQNELEVAVDRAVEQTVEKMNEGWYATATSGAENELKADLCEGIASGVRSDSDLDVQIMGCDNGLKFLSVRAVATFKNPDGSTGRVTAERTAALVR